MYKLGSGKNIKHQEYDYEKLQAQIIFVQIRLRKKYFKHKEYDHTELISTESSFLQRVSRTTDVFGSPKTSEHTQMFVSPL